MIGDSITAAEARKYFWVFTLGQALLWTLLPALVFHNLPMDVIEGLSWGHGWPIGTHKHPPLQAWLLEIFAILGQGTDLGIYALGGLSLLVTYVSLRKLGKFFLTPSQNLAGVMALCSCFYFATSVPEINPNTLQIPLYALCGLFFWRGVTQDKILDWIMLGCCAALGLYAKYSFALMLLVFLCFALIDPLGRTVWRRKGSWLAGAVMLALLSPHLWWLREHSGLVLGYAESRTSEFKGLGDYLLSMLHCILNQLLIVLPVAIILWLARGQRRSAPTTPLAKSAGRYLGLLACAPFLIIIALSLAFGQRPRDMWAMPIWPFLGLYLAWLWQSDLRRSSLARMAVILALVAMPVATLSGAILSTTLGFRPWRTEFPGKELAAAATEFWQAEGLSGTPRIIISDAWYGGNVAWYGARRVGVAAAREKNNLDRAHTFIYGDYLLAPWVTPDMVAQSGAIGVWDPREGRTAPQEWIAKHGRILAQKTVTLRYGRDDVPYGLAIIVPTSPQ
jgi:4-amino-4-deoxy-L-arabinose transferase-like glycosyltransferase